jgi:hypothetical protein
VSLQCSANPYELIWENAFDDEEGHRSYLTHPYHCNFIDHLMYRESPACLVEEGSMVLGWDAGQPFDVAGAVERRKEREAGSPAARTARAIKEESAGLEEQAIYLVEHIDVRPGSIEAYLKAFRDTYLPAATARGMKLLIALESPPGDGQEVVMVIWEIPGWHAWSRIRASFHFDKDWLTSWLETVEPLRLGGQRRFLQNAPMVAQ